MDHPRACGVYGKKNVFTFEAEGSSPRVRGLRGRCWRPWCALRIIPARAGFTGVSSLMTPRCRDHPRTRGVYPGYDGDLDLSVGSSPHARGLRDVRGSFLCVCRIIPARAGFTAETPENQPKTTDHPRTRGVYGTPPCTTHTLPGSSPHARGLPGHQKPEVSDMGIIPARAGFTPSPSRACTRSSDHPRTRGVYVVVCVLGRG